MPSSNQDDLLILRVLSGLAGRSAFRRLTVLLVQHLLADSVSLVNAFRTAGCSRDRLFVIGVPYSSKRATIPTIMQLAAQDGVICPVTYPLRNADGTYNEAIARVVDAALDSCKNDGELIIVEDGAYALPYLLAHRSDMLRRCLGVVQQTTRGVRIYEYEIAQRRADLPFPVISLVRCELKERHEPRWLMEPIEGNIRSLLAEARPEHRGRISGQRILVMGFGTVSRTLCQSLRAQGAVVMIDEPNPVRYLEAQELDFICGHAEDLVVEHGCDIVMASTGAKPSEPSVTQDILERLPDGAVLLSTASGNDEIDLPALANLAELVTPSEATHDSVLRIPDFTQYTLRDHRTLHVLYSGFPVNFWSESMSNNHADAIISLLFKGALRLAGEKKQSTMDHGLIEHCVLLREQEEISRLFGVLYPR